MFIKRYTLKGSFWLIIGVIIVTSFNGCDKIKTCTSFGTFDGQIVSCYPKDLAGERFGKFCTSSDKPPCECWDISRTENQLITVPWLDTQCDPSIGNIGSPGSNFGLSGTAYQFDCPSGTDEVLCTQFDVYFNDKRLESNDNNYRPVYVRFSLTDFAIKKNDYLFQVVDLFNNVVDSYLLSGINMTEERIRRLEPANCGDLESCATQGVVKMDIKKTLDSPLKIKLIRISLENGAESEVASKLFDGRFNETYFNKTSDKREMPYATLLSSGLVSPQESFEHYTIGGMRYSDAMKYVFGDGKSNLKMYSQQFIKLSSYYIDEQLDMKLDRRDIGNTDGEMIEKIMFAMRRWSKDVYLFRVAAIYPNIKGFITVPDYVNSYNLTTHEEEPGFKEEAKTALGAIGGVTMTAYPDFDDKYYNGVIVFRERSIEVGTSTGVPTNTISMWSILHEFGHLWAPSATDPSITNDCQKHAFFSTGRNSNICLFHHSCQQTPEDSQAFLTGSLANPTFCEGHQQYFMNRLNPR
jgi:hypothetical protein